MPVGRRTTPAHLAFGLLGLSFFLVYQPAGLQAANCGVLDQEISQGFSWTGPASGAPSTETTLSLGLAEVAFDSQNGLLPDWQGRCGLGIETTLGEGAMALRVGSAAPLESLADGSGLAPAGNWQSFAALGSRYGQANGFAALSWETALTGEIDQDSQAFSGHLGGSGSLSLLGDRVRAKGELALSRDGETAALGGARHLRLENDLLTLGPAKFETYGFYLRNDPTYDSGAAAFEADRQVTGFGGGLTWGLADFSLERRSSRNNLAGQDDESKAWQEWEAGFGLATGDLAAWAPDTVDLTWSRNAWDLQGDGVAPGQAGLDQDFTFGLTWSDEAGSWRFAFAQENRRETTAETATGAAADWFRSQSLALAFEGPFDLFGEDNWQMGIASRFGRSRWQSEEDSESGLTFGLEAALAYRPDAAGDQPGGPPWGQFEFTAGLGAGREDREDDDGDLDLSLAVNYALSF